MTENTKEALAAQTHYLGETLYGLDAADTVDLSSLAQRVMFAGRVHVTGDVYRLCAGEVPMDGNASDNDATARLLDLLCSAKQDMKPDGIGYFSHLLRPQHSRGGFPNMYRFAIFESSHLNGDWLITESAI